MGPATEADDAIVACIEGADADTICSNGDLIFDTSNKRWFSTPAPATNTPANSCVRFADTANDFADAEAPVAGANNRFPYDAGDQFNVDGAASNFAGSRLLSRMATGSRSTSCPVA